MGGIVYHFTRIRGVKGEKKNKTKQNNRKREKEREKDTRLLRTSFFCAVIMFFLFRLLLLPPFSVLLLFLPSPSATVTKMNTLLTALCTTCYFTIGIFTASRLVVAVDIFFLFFKGERRRDLSGKKVYKVHDL